jgi:hypothetical protein
MTLVALSPLRQQGDVSRVLAALPAVLLQDSGAPPAATPSHVQRPSSPPTATLACTQGLGTPLPDTLEHSYAPRCTPGLSPCLYKRGVLGHPEGGSCEGSGGRTLCPPLSLSLTRRACNPYCERHPWCRIIQSLSHILCSIPRQPIWAGTRSDNLLVGPGTPPRGSKRRQFFIMQEWHHAATRQINQSMAWEESKPPIQCKIAQSITINSNGDRKPHKKEG